MTADNVPARVFSQIGPWGMVPVWILDPEVYLPGVPDRTKLKSGDERPLNASELRVYISLRSFSNQSGYSKLFVTTIAERAKVDKSTAERAISKFKRLGWLVTKRLYRPDGSIHRCDYYLADLCPQPDPSAGPEPEGVPVDSRVPHPRNHGYPTRESTGAKNTPDEHTKRTQSEVKRGSSARFAPEAAHDEERPDLSQTSTTPPDTADGNDAPCEQWRTRDKAAFKEFLGERFRSKGRKPWRPGEFSTDDLYKALLDGVGGTRTPAEWPGRLLMKIDEDEGGLDDWLLSQGFELLDRDMPAAA